MDSTDNVATEVTAGSDNATTELTEEPQMKELLTQETGLSIEIEVKVIRCEIMDYSYFWQQKQVLTQKLQVVLQSKIADQYCLGVAKTEKKKQNRAQNHG